MAKNISQEEFLGGGSFEIVPQQQILNDRVKQGFFSRVRERLQERGRQLAETTGQLSSRQIGAVRSGFRTAGTFAGAIGDVAGEALVSGFRALPDVIEQPIRRGTVAVLNTPLGRKGVDALEKGIEAYTSFKEENPETAKDLEAVVNIASILPVGALPQRTAQTVSRTGLISRAGGTLRESGETGARLQKEGFVRQLVRPQQTKKVKESQVARTSERGAGPFRTSEIAPTPQELRAERAVLTVPQVSSRATVQRNFNFIQDEVSREAENLVSLLKENDFVFPKRELLSRLNTARSEVLRSPSLVGSDENVARKLIAELNGRINRVDAKGSSLLRLRKDFDEWVRRQKGSNVFSPDRENAFSIVNRELRQTLNDFLEEKAVNVDVRASLSRQSSLLYAMENLVPKAAIEADTAFRRALQRIGEVLGVKSRIVQGIAAAVGIGGLGAAATFAPVAAVVGIGGFLIFKGGKLILSPKARRAFGTALINIQREIDKTSKNLKRAAELVTIKAALQRLIDQYSE